MDNQRSSDSDIIEIYFGTRTLNNQHKNKTIVIPRVCLENIGASQSDKLKITLVQTTDGKKFIKLENVDSGKLETVGDKDEL
jgi:hypothetical protein